MGFLSSIGKALGIGGDDGAGILGDLLGLGGTAYSIYEAFNEPELPAGVQQSADRASRIAAALSDPNDPLMLQMEQREEGNIRRDFATALNDLAIANRRAAARTGGLGILNPERRDEALAGATARGLVDVKAQARDRARSYLSNALAANSAAAGAYQPILKNQQQDRLSRLVGIGGVSALGKTLAGGTSLGGGLLNGDPRELTINLQGFGDRLSQAPVQAFGPSIYTPGR